ncbi:MAG: glycosyltransferase [Deltaproteobacteria bacterium]|nr:glycosyltransferase [Deltaproteobacteria bacterium]
MKVCDIVQFYSPLSGGVKRYIKDKIRYFSCTSAVSQFIIIPSHRNAVCREKDTRIYEIKSPPLIGSKSYRMLIAQKRMFDIIYTERPDLIEVGDPYRCAWIGLEAGRSLGVPVVAVYHSDYPRSLSRTVGKYGGPFLETLSSRTIEKYLVNLYNRMDMTVVPTERFLHTLKNMGIFRLIHVPLGTDPDMFYPRNSRNKVFQELALPPEAMLLLYVGRLSREKNIEQLLKMMEYFGPDDAPIHLLLVGDGELRDKARAATKSRDDVSWFPYCEKTERLAELYSAADVFVHAGTAETFGLVSLEAQACGTRVLAVQDGGMDETLEGEDPLIMAFDGRASTLAQSVRRIRQLNETRECRMARRGRIIKRFYWEDTYGRLVDLYERLVEGKLMVNSSDVLSEAREEPFFHQAL